MKDKMDISLLIPKDFDGEFNEISETVIHDLALDTVIRALSKKESEQVMILRFMQKITSDVHVAKYRADVFEDFLNNKEMRDELLKILEKINFIRDYGKYKATSEAAPSAWELLRRLAELKDYINLIEAFSDRLSKADIRSEGLVTLKEYVDRLHSESDFEELKADIVKLKATTDNLKSVTLGVNLNSDFTAESIGVVSINSKPFTRANILSTFYDKIAKRDDINDSTDWNDNYKYHQFEPEQDNNLAPLERLARISAAATHPLLVYGLTKVPEEDAAIDATRYMNRITNHMLALSTKRLHDTIRKYVSLKIADITNLIPEFLYYIRWAEYVEKLIAAGYTLNKPEPVAVDNNERIMKGEGVYNIKLLFPDAQIESAEDIVKNRLHFDREHMAYILTGANRGGKTTITQAAGQLFLMAQCGVYVCADKFEYNPVDNIFTHFPADEDKTMDLGRLGEECKRFKSIFNGCSADSLVLLNETFSTTSFEEGYYIAASSVRAILNKGIRTIYNTHMHKLAESLDEINADEKNVGKAASLVVKSENGNRSFKVEVAPPEGMSYAEDIARKYGVTYDQLVE